MYPHAANSGCPIDRRNARRLPRPRPVRRRITEAIVENTSRQCECAGCFRSRHKLSRYCKDHAARFDLSGHPVALNIGRNAWRPYVRQAERFIYAQLREEHPSIGEAIRWVTKELDAAEQPARYDDAALLGYWAALLRARRNGVDAIQFLGRWIAGELADVRGTEELGPRYASDRFASDTHAAQQRARLLLTLKPIGRSSWAKRKTTPQEPRVSKRLPWRVRAYAYERWNCALGVLALKAAEAIRRQANRANERSLSHYDHHQPTESTAPE